MALFFCPEYTRWGTCKKMATVETVALLIEWTVYMRKTELTI
jgi:hypothetical protein